jgi:predicted RNase H-like HicB family nuclease
VAATSGGSHDIFLFDSSAFYLLFLDNYYPVASQCKRSLSQGVDKMHRFLIIIEKGTENYGAYSPDLPGCVAVGDTLEEVEKNMREAIIMHIQGMIEDHEPIPIPQSTAEYMEIPIPDSAA